MKKTKSKIDLNLGKTNFFKTSSPEYDENKLVIKGLKDIAKDHR